MSRCRIGQEHVGFVDRRGPRGSSLDDPASIIDWAPVECAISRSTASV